MRFLLALSVVLIPGAAFLGTLYAGRTVYVGGIVWGVDEFPGLVQFYYRVGPVGYSLVGVVALAGIVAFWPLRARVVSVLGAGALLLVSVFFCFANGCLVHNKILRLSAGDESPFDKRVDLRADPLPEDSVE